jgi:Uma2 family endonuclease
MAVATAPRLLTYEEYLAEGEVMQRYDIVDGVRYVTNPNRRHQRILVRLTELLRAYERSSRVGEVLVSPTDVLISREPLRVRQPDVLFISYARLAHCAAEDDPEPLLVGPELVVEILSPSESRAVRAGKFEDYRRAGVDECWVIVPEARIVEVLRLNAGVIESMALYRADEEVISRIFPDLRVPVAALFTDA